MSLLHVYFKDHSLVQYNQDVLYTIEDLIAAFGGLVGLCTGLSLLSILEFLYFFTLRWGLQFCREKKCVSRVVGADGGILGLNLYK